MNSSQIETADGTAGHCERSTRQQPYVLSDPLRLEDCFDVSYFAVLAPHDHVAAAEVVELNDLVRELEIFLKFLLAGVLE
jgi:hypothetical protein